ncbi:MAG: hypothetical protein P8Y25_04585, partial [Chromatiaceae bacterium]
MREWLDLAANPAYPGPEKFAKGHDVWGPRPVRSREALLGLAKISDDESIPQHVREIQPQGVEGRHPHPRRLRNSGDQPIV